MAGCLSSQAALITFELAPVGTNDVAGLSPTNETQVVNSTGSGGLISGGVVFDDSNNSLSIAVGYGSAAGFTDLSGPATAMHIHGPAGPDEDAPPIVDLMPYNFPAADPAKGGVITAKITFPAASVADLLAGRTYINIHTTAYGAGEIRGQLVALVVANSPPQVSCGANTTVECGSSSETTVIVSDPEGDALSVVWTVNGTAVQTNTVAASNPPASANVSYSATLPVGTNVIGVTVTDAATNSASCSSQVIVVDTTPPVIDSVRAEPNVLWPPNHRLVPIRLTARVSDSCSDTAWKVVEVSSSEVDNGRGDGNTSGDWLITGDHTVKLRAERSGNGSGRLYSITIQAYDSAGNASAIRTVNVLVPKSKGKSASAPKITVADTKAKIAAAKAKAEAAAKASAAAAKAKGNANAAKGNGKNKNGG